MKNRYSTLTDFEKEQFEKFGKMISNEQFEVKAQIVNSNHPFLISINNGSHTNLATYEEGMAFLEGCVKMMEVVA